MKSFKELTREERMNELLEHVNAILHRIHPDRPYLFVDYLAATKENLEQFSEWDRTRFCLRPGNEYFIVSENESPCDKSHNYYAVNISCDSPLTAMDELFHLLSYKF